MSMRVHFRVAVMQCCHVVLCLVNPRFPNYCPECGKHVYPDVKQWVVSDFPEAIIQIQRE